MENGFQERDTGLKEMEGFDKYVTIITDTKGIDKRWELCKYFTTVTPTKRLRDGWLAYQESIKKDYDAFEALQKREDNIIKKDSLTKADQKELASINIEKAKFETSITGNSQENWVIIFTSDTNLPQAQYEFDRLIKAGIDSPRLILRGGLYQTTSGNYNSRAEAQSYLTSVKSKFTSNPYVSNMAAWCANPVYNGTYYECK